MPTGPICEVHVHRSTRVVTLIRYVYEPELHLSVVIGDLIEMPWQEFVHIGMELVAKCLETYFESFNPGRSQFESLTEEQRKAFHQERLSFLIASQGAEEWEIDAMVPTDEDSSIVLPTFPRSNALFRQKDGNAAFLQVLNQLASRSGTNLMPKPG